MYTILQPSGGDKTSTLTGHNADTATSDIVSGHSSSGSVVTEAQADRSSTGSHFYHLAGEITPPPGSKGRNSLYSIVI